MTNEERAFAVLTLLVAVTEQAAVELERLDSPPHELLADLARVHDAAVDVGHQFADRGGTERI